MSRLRADLAPMAGVPAGSYVLPNTRAVTDNFVLEYDNGGYVTLAWDEYRVAARSGYIVKRSRDEDGNDVDWSALTAYPFYWSGTVVTPNGRYPVTREPLEFYDEQEPAPPIDRENAINLELAYDAIVDTLIAAGGAFAVDERGFAFGSPPPTYDESAGTYSGTGVLGNAAGVVGVNAGVVQFEDRVSDGKRYAGAGAVVMDQSGIDLLTGVGDQNQISWVVAHGSAAASFIRADDETSLKINVNDAEAGSSGTFDLNVFDGLGDFAGLRLSGSGTAHFNGSAFDGVVIDGTTTQANSTATDILDVYTIANNTGLKITFLGSSGASVGPQVALYTNDTAAVASADRIGQIVFGGYNGTALTQGGHIIGRATETWSGTARGNKLEFYTVPNTTTTITLAMTINQDAEVDFAGNADVAGGKVYKVNGTQVVGARDTGWTAMTGTANENTSYDTASVTLPQLAGRVMALQAALTTHGLIGA